MKKGLFIFMLCLLWAALAVSAHADVVISEIMTNNGVFTDGEHYDWVELHNNGKESVDISGWGLSDKKE